MNAAEPASLQSSSSPTGNSPAGDWLKTNFHWLALLPLGFFIARAIQYISVAKTPEQILWSCHISNLMMAFAIFFRIPWLIRISAFWQILGLPPWVIDMFNSGITPISVITHLGGCTVAMLALWVVRGQRGSWLPSLVYFIILQQITKLLTVPGPYTNVNVAHFAYGGMKDWFASYWTYWLANTAVTAVVLWLMDWALVKIFPPSKTDR